MRVGVLNMGLVNVWQNAKQNLFPARYIDCKVSAAGGDLVGLCDITTDSG